MVFKFLRSATSPEVRGYSGMGAAVIDTNTLRQAALQNSWQRDQRIARRRLAMRWVLWWMWKYRYGLLALGAVLAFVIYRFASAAYPAVSSGAAPEVISAPANAVSLRMQPQLLQPGRAQAAPTAAPDAAPTTFQLKSETQLKTKETNP